MTKKAFTIVEITVVLVIIGIIVGMAYKSSKLLETARMRGEAGRLHNFEIGFLAYYQRHGKLPNCNNSNNKYDNDDLISKKILSSSDLRIDFGALTGGVVPPWEFLCNLIPDSSDGYFTPNTGPIHVENAGAYHQQLAASLICFLENTVDDDNVSGGAGRTFGGAYTLDVTSCDQVSRSLYFPYVYMVFAPTNM